MKYFFITLFSLFFLGVRSASAHVTVKPTSVEPAMFQVFSVSVPSEKDIHTTGIRIVLPEGLAHVTPTVKLGWTVETKKEGDSIKEVSWIGGTIPSGQRDEFSFSAQVPSEATTLVWKAYQTYANGVVVSWDQAETSDSESGDRTSGPYSLTEVAESSDPSEPTPLWLGMIATLLGLTGIVIALKK